MGLRRILEPEVMDSEKDAVEYDSMDFTEVNMAFARRALELAPPGGRLLDMGTGTARIPILMLQLSRTDLMIDASDLSRAMLKVAERNVREAGLQHRIRIVLADAKERHAAAGTYDIVVSNSLAHHIPEPLSFFTSLGEMAKPNAALLVRDLLRPESEEAAEALVQQYAGSADEYQQRLYRDSLHAALTIPEVEAYLKGTRITGATVLQSSDRHWSLERPAA